MTKHTEQTMQQMMKRIKARQEAFARGDADELARVKADGQSVADRIRAAKEAHGIKGWGQS